MKVFWSPRASQDLQAMVDFISADKPSAAVRVADRIRERVSMLEEMPQMGRLGYLPGTRELVFPPWPYVAIYRMTPESVRILRIRHTSRYLGAGR